MDDGSKALLTLFHFESPGAMINSQLYIIACKYVQTTVGQKILAKFGLKTKMQGYLIGAKKKFRAIPFDQAAKKCCT